MLLFSNLLPRRHPGGFPKLYFDMKFWNFSKFSKKWKIFKPKQGFGRPPGGLLGFRFGKSNISAFTGKKIITLSCLEKILGFVTYLPSKWVYPPIFRCAIFVVFSALFERKSKLQTKIQLRKASWRPPEFHIWKKAISQLSLKKKLSHHLFLNKIKICKHKNSETVLFCWKYDKYGISENRCRTSFWWKIHYKT